MTFTRPINDFFDSAVIVNNSKIAILIASVIAGTIGFLWLKWTLKDQQLKTKFL